MLKKGSEKSNSELDFIDFIDSFINIIENKDSDSNSRKIELCLRQISDFFDSSRAYVFTYSLDYKLTSIAHQYAQKGVSGFSEDWKNLPLQGFAYVTSFLFKHEPFVINAREELPETAQMENIWMSTDNISSVVLIPLITQQRLIGFMGVDYIEKSHLWEEQEIKQLRGIAGNLTRLMDFCFDELEKKEKETLYRSLFEGASDAICVFKSGKCIDCNHASLEEINGVRQEVIGKSVSDLFLIRSGQSIFDSSILKSEMTESNNPTPAHIEEWKLKKLDGEVVDVEVSINRFSSLDSSIIMVLFRNIMGRKKREKALASREKQLRKKLNKLLSPGGRLKHLSFMDLFDLGTIQRLQNSFSEATGITSVITTLDGEPITEISLSSRACQLFRRSKGEFPNCNTSNKDLLELSKTNRQPAIKRCGSCGQLGAIAPLIIEGDHIANWVIGQVGLPGFSRSYLVELSKKQVGTEDSIQEYPYEIKAISDTQFEKTVELLNIMVSDLSELGFNNLKLAKSLNKHVKLEKKLRSAKQKAEENDQLKSAFLANMSHEIRTPMNGIIGFADLLSDYDINEDEKEDFLDIIKKNSQQLLSIINDIIDVSKIESGQIRIDKSHVSISQMLQDVFGIFKMEAADRGLELTYDCFHGREVVIETDEIKLRQILTNLITNAIKYSERGTIKLSATPYHEPGYVLFSVEDSGLGIDQKDHKNVFNRFWQVDNSQQRKGTGLGLTITKAFVDLLGGSIWLESEIGKGSSFRFTLPTY